MFKRDVKSVPRYINISFNRSSKTANNLILHQSTLIISYCALYPNQISTSIYIFILLLQISCLMWKDTLSCRYVCLLKSAQRTADSFEYYGHTFWLNHIYVYIYHVQTQIKIYSPNQLDGGIQNSLSLFTLKCCCNFCGVILIKTLSGFWILINCILYYAFACYLYFLNKISTA